MFVYNTISNIREPSSSCSFECNRNIPSSIRRVAGWLSLRIKREGHSPMLRPSPSFYSLFLSLLIPLNRPGLAQRQCLELETSYRSHLGCIGGFWRITISSAYPITLSSSGCSSVLSVLSKMKQIIHKFDT